MFGEFEIKDKKLALKVSVDELTKKYNLSKFDVDTINKMLSRRSNTTQSEKNVFVDDWKIYFDNQDLHDYLYAAAAMGPVALMAAFDSLIALMSGPIGVALAAFLDGIALFAGEIYLGDICYKIVYCTLNGKGFYIGFDWSVPAPAFGEW